MTNALDVLEADMRRLRREVRAAAGAGDAGQARARLAELRRARSAWDALLFDEPATGPVAAVRSVAPAGRVLVVPAREHVHQALTLLQVPAAPKLIEQVHQAFFAGELTVSKLTSLRRDEERSYRAAAGARPYYLCPALTYDLLSPARALLTISTSPLDRRIIGPLSPRVDFLTSALRIADMVRALAESDGAGPSPAALRLLERFAATIPGAMPTNPTGHENVVDPRRVIDAAAAERAVHADADQATRAESARQARTRLDEDQLLFGRPR